jgi:predicted DCC family thiol-disulfide oxidoreductase YuxK
MKVGDSVTTARAQLDTQLAPMLVYDGSCGFCSRSVQFILRHERRHDLLFVPRDSELGRELRREYGMEAVESMLWIAGDQVFAESGAVLKAANYLGGGWSSLAAVGSLFPAFLLNGIYKFIARNRRRISAGLLANGSPAVCLVPSAEQRSRFLS